MGGMRDGQVSGADGRRKARGEIGSSRCSIGSRREESQEIICAERGEVGSKDDWPKCFGSGRARVYVG